MEDQFLVIAFSAMTEARFEVKVLYSKEFRFAGINEKTSLFFNQDDIIQRRKAKRKVMSKELTTLDEILIMESEEKGISDELKYSD